MAGKRVVKAYSRSKSKGIPKSYVKAGRKKGANYSRKKG